MQPVPFSSGQYPAKFFLIRPGKIETGNIRTGVHFPLAQSYELKAVGNGFKNGPVRINPLVLLVHIRQLHGISYLEIAAVRLFQSHYQTEKSRLSGSVRPDDTHNTGRRQRKIKIFKKYPSVIGF